MDSLLIAALALIVGLALGVACMYAFRVSERQRAADVDVEEPSMPEGATEVLASLGLGYIVVDTVDGVVRANPAAYAFGLVRGHTVVHREVLALTARVRGDGVIIEEQLELPRGLQGETSIVVNLRVAPLGDEYILVLADDRTEVSRTEAVRNDFVANVSHELKTPVGAISLLAETIEDAADDEQAVRRFSQRLHKESVRLAALVQDIIELSRVQGKNVVHAGKPVDLNDAMAEAVDRSRMTAEERRIEIRAGGRVPRRVHGDAEQLTMAFRNLIDNALRYSPESTRVGVGLTSADGVAEVTITDQGMGIAPENQERIFERFYRVDAARSRQTGGTGLGLSIVKHVIGNHGGDIALWSQQGKGSTFTVRLPEIDEGLDSLAGLAGAEDDLNDQFAPPERPAEPMPAPHDSTARTRGEGGNA
ncbi:sensor histidine kinase [Nesterenkonia populi]|uniref:sensor histidine kinase n=1 Tax=Nesterenkonia populi TaxID=1591087 RepID=UPI0011BE4D83|nr:ATP-binding protein [Nesterenkonia populi]